MLLPCLSPELGEKKKKDTKQQQTSIIINNNTFNKKKRKKENAPGAKCADDNLSSLNRNID